MADEDVGQGVLDSISKPYRTVYEKVTHFFGDPTTPAAGTKAPQMNWKPEANAEQQKEIDDRNAPAKDAETKPLSQRTLGAKKRPAIKKPTTNQTQRKQP